MKQMRTFMMGLLLIIAFGIALAFAVYTNSIGGRIAAALIIGAITGGSILWLMVSKHKSVKMQSGADNYMLRHTFRLEHSRDIYLYSHVTRVAKPQNNNSKRR